ncbi:hypothetical protein INT47_001541 [Mucor saturninus]|uniref:Uncharacterized protein n=1 Tax=Mucor saturninus TaxID=64648 RepID=A0A8H7UZU1_9FUNG|nr:hypothetical protein INT47_001541 [Mucor saturninus]
MGWVGPRGYMFAVKKINDIYMQQDMYFFNKCDITFGIRFIMETLSHSQTHRQSFHTRISTSIVFVYNHSQKLVYYENHHTYLKDTILKGKIAKEDDDFFLSFANGTDNTGIASKGLLPNACSTPIKAKKKQLDLS